MTHPLKLYFLSEGMTFIYFWIALAVPYLEYRGLTVGQALTLMSVYQLAGVVLEYPTSVFGDRYGYKLSLVIADVLLGLSMFLLVRPGSYSWYLFALLVLSVANGFLSGNTQGLLNSLSSNIRHDNARRSTLAELVLFVSAIVGTWIGAISFELALYTSGIIMLAAVLPLTFIHPPPSPKRQHTSTIIKDSLLALRSAEFRHIYLLLAVFGGYHFSVKSIFGSFGKLYSYSLSAIGWLVGLGGLAKAAGSYLYIRTHNISLVMLGAITSFAVLLSGFVNPLSSSALLLFFLVSIGYLTSHLDADIHSLTSDHIRSSLFAFKRLLIRLFSSVFLYLIGLAIDSHLFSLFTLKIGLIMLLTVYLARHYLSQSKAPPPYVAHS